MKNKKTMGISIVAVILLVIAIIATSYAVFTANLSGTKENEIESGYVKLNCAETGFTVENTSAMTDAQGIGQNNNTASCTLTSTMNGSMVVGYDVALANVTPSASISTSNVKIQASKKVDTAAATYIAGTTANTGVTIQSLESSAGTYDTSITSYKIDSDTITGNHTIVYTIKSWLASGGNASATTTNNSGVCSDKTKTTKEACEAAGAIWGDQQLSSSAGGNFTFKLKVGATQVLTRTGN